MASQQGRANQHEPACFGLFSSWSFSSRSGIPLHAVVRLETRGGQVYNRREEDTEQKGCEHAPLTKTLFHSEPPRAHLVVEPYACSHAMVELTNDRDHNLWHAKTGEYCPEEGSVNEFVRFGKVDKAHIERDSFLPRQLLYRRITNIILVVERFGLKPLCFSG